MNASVINLPVYVRLPKLPLSLDCPKLVQVGNLIALLLVVSGFCLVLQST